MTDARTFYGQDYIQSLKEHYPELAASLNTIDANLRIGVVNLWAQWPRLVGVDPVDRFQPIEKREFTMLRNAWSVAADPSPSGLQRVGASSTYKGIALLKPPSDLVLYTSLIWELQPATIVEFGAFQGGSSLWFADQLSTLVGNGTVHSFELLDKCVHPTAVHPSLQFHRADLRDLRSLDRDLLASLPHPWLVVDDAHENLDQLIPYIGGLLHTGDYYVIEDVLLKATPELVQKWVALCAANDLVVDTKYTDAFGYNVTCSPNSWLKKI